MAKVADFLEKVSSDEAFERWLNSPMTRSLPMRSSRAASENTTR